MKSPFLLVLLAAPLALGQGSQSALLSALQGNPNTLGFGNLLAQYPDFLATLDNTQFTVFAPSNAAVSSFLSTLNGSTTSHRLARQSTIFPPVFSMLFALRSSTSQLGLTPTTIETFLTNPSFVNLGPTDIIPNNSTSSSSSTSGLTSSTQSISSSGLTSSTISIGPSSSIPTTSSAASSTPSPSNGVHYVIPVTPPPPGMKKNRRQSQNPVSIFTGLGAISTVSEDETPYSGGGIRQVDSFFTLPQDLPSTLQQTNGTKFSALLSNASLLNTLSATPKITIFVPINSALQGPTLDAATLKRYVLLNTFGVTPDLTSSSYTTYAGDTIKVTVNPDGSISVNNAKIVKSNVMMKNGVIHYIDNTFALTVTSSAAGIGVPMQLVIAGIITMVVSYMSLFSL